MSTIIYDDLSIVLDEVINIVNYIKVKLVKYRIFEKICKDMGTENFALLMHTHIRSK